MEKEEETKKTEKCPKKFQCDYCSACFQDGRKHEGMHRTLDSTPAAKGNFYGEPARVRRRFYLIQNVNRMSEDYLTIIPIPVNISFRSLNKENYKVQQ